MMVHFTTEIKSKDAPPSKLRLVGDPNALSDAQVAAIASLLLSVAYAELDADKIKKRR